MDSRLRPSKVANSEIAEYVSLLHIRKKWSLIGMVALGIGSVVSLAAAVSLMWALRDKTITSTTMLVVAVLCIYPSIGLVNQVVEYRRLKGVLELLDVLQRAASKDTLPIVCVSR